MTRYRTLFISDIHLGSRLCHAKDLLDLLNCLSYDNIVLVGDIIEQSRFNNIERWPKEQQELFSMLFFNTSNNRSKIIYVVGNHDTDIGKYTFNNIDNIEIVEYTTYTSLHGAKYLVEHGHRANSIRIHDSLIIVWVVLYDLIGYIFRIIDKMLKTQSSLYIIRRCIKNIMMLLTSYNRRLDMLIECFDCDGIIFGHLHKPSIKHRNGLTYLNCGDWIEHKTLLAEDYNGEFHILKG